MKRKKKLGPHSPEVIEAALEMIRQMTPDEAWEFLTYKTPGIEETDMTGMLADIPYPPKKRPASLVVEKLKPIK